MVERNIRITFTGHREAKVFAHKGRSGGSYTKELTLEHGFAVITDEWGKKTIYPSYIIREIEVTESR